MRGSKYFSDSFLIQVTSNIYRDNVEWSDEQKLQAEEAVKKNSSVRFSEEEIEEFETLQATKWDDFYNIHQNKFFKDRHWLFTEFPELAPKADVPEKVYASGEGLVPTRHFESRKIFEIGSGVGNSIKLTINLIFSFN